VIAIMIDSINIVGFFRVSLPTQPSSGFVACALVHASRDPHTPA
jgi:hypothetical protein